MPTCVVVSGQQEPQKPKRRLPWLAALVIASSIASNVLFINRIMNVREAEHAIWLKDREKIETLQDEVERQKERVAQYEAIKKYTLRVGKEPIFVQGTLAVFVVR